MADPQIVVKTWAPGPVVHYFDQESLALAFAAANATTEKMYTVTYPDGRCITILQVPPPSVPKVKGKKA